MSFPRNTSNKTNAQSPLSHLKNELVYPMENMSLQSESVAQTKRPPRSAVDAFEASLGPRKTYTKVVSKPETPAKATLSVATPPPPPPPLATPPPPALPSLPNQRLSTPPAIPNSPRPPKNDKKVTVLNPIYAGIECAACNRAIDGHEVVHAADKTFHSGCFTCSKCGQSLADKHFYEKNNQILCERDYKDAFSMHCDFCGEYIENQAIFALDKYYHEGHFCCVVCKSPFEDQQGFMVHDGKPYCQQDYMTSFGKKCGGCQQFINGEYIDAMDQHWHKKCFVCTDCKKPFENGYLQRDGKPYCEEHINAPKKLAPPPLKPKPTFNKPAVPANNKPEVKSPPPSIEKPSRGQSASGKKVCHTCHEGIDGPCASALDHDYHVNHFQCYHCSRPLSSRVPGMWQSDKSGELICKMCAFKQS